MDIVKLIILFIVIVLVVILLIRLIRLERIVFKLLGPLNDKNYRLWKEKYRLEEKLKKKKIIKRKRK
jgi:hypothetical protein